MLRRGQDPRKILEGHKERGPKRFTYSYEDIAQAANMTEGAVRVAVCRGQLDPESLSSVVEFIADRRGLSEQKTTFKKLVQEARELSGLEGNEE